MENKQTIDRQGFGAGVNIISIILTSGGWVRVLGSMRVLYASKGLVLCAGAKRISKV